MASNLIETSAVALAALILLMGMSIIYDLKYRQIPNFLTFTGAGVGLFLQGWIIGFSGFGSGVLGGLAGLALFLPFYAVSGMGGGDVKLLASIGTFVGFPTVILSAACTLVVGLVCALTILICRGAVAETLRRYKSFLYAVIGTRSVSSSYIPPAEGDVAQSVFPYAVPTLVGTLLSLGWGGQIPYPTF